MADGLSRVQQIGQALGGFGAGIQGNLPQFQTAQNQRRQLEAQETERQRVAQIARQEQIGKFTAGAARQALELIEAGDFDQALMLGESVITQFSQLGLDPSGAQRISALLTAAGNGSDEAKKLAISELEIQVRLGESFGFIDPPEVKSKIVGNFLVNETTGKVIFDATEEDKRATEKDVNGRWRYIDDSSLVFPQVDVVAKGLEGKERNQVAQGFRNEIAKENGEFLKIANSWDRITASAADPSPAGDLALIFNFMKMLDPGSTVREGEFATAAQSANLPTRIVGMYNRLRVGERLPENQRADFFKQAQNIFDASSERARGITDEFVRIAEEAGLTREEVVVERGAAPDISEIINAAQTAVEVTNQAEFDALPSGAFYKEDGNLFRKP